MHHGCNDEQETTSVSISSDIDDDPSVRSSRDMLIRFAGFDLIYGRIEERFLMSSEKGDAYSPNLMTSETPSSQARLG